MKKPETVSLHIEHVEDYKILFLECLDNVNAYDLSIVVVMIQNFFDHCKKNNTKFAWVFNVKKMNQIPLFTLEELSKFCKKNFPVIRDNLICNCILSNDGLFKNFFKLFTKLYQPTKPLKNFDDDEDCMPFIQDCLMNKYKTDTILY